MVFFLALRRDDDGRTVVDIVIDGDICFNDDDDDCDVGSNDDEYRVVVGEVSVMLVFIFIFIFIVFVDASTLAVENDALRRLEFEL